MNDGQSMNNGGSLDTGSRNSTEPYWLFQPVFPRR